MIYAESDFFLALIKSTDWLKEKAKKQEKKNKGKIETSLISLIEILIVGKRHKLDPEKIINSVFKISKVKGIKQEEALAVTQLIKYHKIGIFDAFHAVLSREKPILSSDKAYDRIGKKRIKLEG